MIIGIDYSLARVALATVVLKIAEGDCIESGRSVLAMIVSNIETLPQ